MLEVSPAFLSQISHTVVLPVLAALTLSFVWQFIRPWFRVRGDLRRAVRHLAALKALEPVVDLESLRSEAMPSLRLQHAWDEFRHTLHGQKQVTPSGHLAVSRWRATASASSFFTEQALVDAPLHTEFYKHLPGIMTGLGIIGTFGGLVFGLQAFGRIDLGDATAARDGLRALLSAVGSAFFISGIAIFLAMILTVIEKAIVNDLYVRLESVCGLIDGLFDAGAGEELMQKLVDAAETSATQATQMKETLVTDLREVLAEMTQQQITAMTATTGQLGQTITASLNEGLREPLTRISDAVQSVGSSQGDAINRMLTDVLSSFSSQMENMFGGQLRGMGEMLSQTAQTIQAASVRFEQLAEKVQQTGSSTTDAMARRMDEALSQMQARQGEANEQMRQFIEQLKRSVAEGQTESAQLQMSMMKELGESTAELVRTLQEQSRNTQQDQSRMQQEAAEQMRAVMQHMQDSVVRNQDASSNQVSRLVDAVQRSEDAMRETIDRIQAATDSHLDRLGASAERLFGASDRLADNLSTMKQQSDGLAGSADRLNTASSILTTAMGQTNQMLGDQKSVRDALTSMVTDLRTTLETAKREATVTSELVDGLQRAAKQLTDAQEATIDNLDEATEAIADAHGVFAKQVESTLREGNRAFHQELSAATEVLRGAIQDLGDVLDALPTPA